MHTVRAQRSVLGVIGALILALAAVFAAGPAQAASSSTNAAVAPPAPQGAQAADVSIAAVSPGISPAANFIHVAAGGTFDCTSGSLCAAVWDPTTSDWKIYYLYTCARYSLSNWNGTGYYFDEQTGGVTSYFYGQSGNVLRSFKPDGGIRHEVDWTPVWSIRNC
ncbi:hypothetical protein GCM10022233_44360 [Streptomyces shaanxiensis]|uniref:Peptidase inhibitor family I36 n=1 Tax=Streptomyces shaanxiensis TaxID=653357 RepID=A0ABP7VE38_9ACTN